jgi:2-polyprenyl-6-methoxyphenol hydroxylase-like FAD-dependent oxidoreductase
MTIGSRGPTKTEVLIVGAGPAGVMLACDLRRREIDVRLIEQIGAPIKASKGKGLQPRTLEVFDDIGIIDRVLAAGYTYPLVRIHKDMDVVKDHVMTSVVDPTPAIPHPNLIMLPQWATEKLLRERLSELGGTIEFCTTFVSLEQDYDRVVATIRSPAGDEEQVVTRYLVGADGGRSGVRKAIGVPLDGENPALEGLLIADVRVARLDRDFWHMWTTLTNRRVTLCPLPATDAFQFAATLDVDEQPEPTLATLQTMLDAATGGRHLTLSNLSWISIYRPNIRMARKFRPLTAGPSVTFANQRYMQTFFGIDANQAARSGYAEYILKGGVPLAGVSVGVEYELTSHWSLGARAALERLQGDAAKSPIVESKNQNVYGLFTLYRF